jgi:hypothetical protein
MYFQRGAYDPIAAAEAQQRLQAFQGATSISSNQYFGREENNGGEDDGVLSGSEGGLLGDGSLSGLESAAREAIQRVMANPDVQNVGESVRSGVLKVCFWWFDFLLCALSWLTFWSSSSRSTSRRCPSDDSHRSVLLCCGQNPILHTLDGRVEMEPVRHLTPPPLPTKTRSLYTFTSSSSVSISLSRVFSTLILTIHIISSFSPHTHGQG